MKRISLPTLAILGILAGCTGGDAPPEPATATSATTSTTGNYGDAIINAQKKAQKMADEQSERAKGVDEVLEESSQ